MLQSRRLEQKEPVALKNANVLRDTRDCRARNAHSVTSVFLLFLLFRQVAVVDYWVNAWRVNAMVTQRRVFQLI